MSTKKQKRRSISVRGDIYDKVHAFCKNQSISMSSFVEDRILRYLENPMDERELKETHDKKVEIKAAAKGFISPPINEGYNKNIAELTDKQLIAEMKQHFTF
jgi:hypothetical protein